MMKRAMRHCVWIALPALLMAGGARAQAQDPARRIFDLTNRDRQAQGELAAVEVGYGRHPMDVLLAVGHIGCGSWG